MGTWESWERIFFSKNVDMAKQRVNEALFERLDVNLVGERTGFSALMLAVAFKHDDRLEIVKRLLARGAKVNTQCSDKNVSALHVAAQKGALDCVTLLLKHEADPTLVDSEGQTPSEVAYSELIDERNRVRQEIKEQCYCRLKHAREDWMQLKLKQSGATPEFRRNVLQSVYRGSPPAKASKKRNPSPEISSTEAIHGSADEGQKRTPIRKTNKDSPKQTTRQRVASGNRKSPYLRGSATGRQSPHQLYINRPGLGKLEIINTPRKVVLEDNLFPSPRLSSRSRNPSSRQRHQSDAPDPFSPRVTPKPSEKSNQEAKKTEALEITALPRPTLTESKNSPKSAFVYPSPEKPPLQERSNNQTHDLTEASEDHSRCLFDDSDKEPSVIEKSHQEEKENSPGSATPRSFREFSTQTPPYLSPVSEVLCPSIPPVTVTPIAPATSSGTTLKRQNEFSLRSKPLKLPVPKVPAALEETINNDSLNKSKSENLQNPSKTKDIPDPTCANSESSVVLKHSLNDVKSTLPKFQGSITETSLFEYFEKSLVLPNLAACEDPSANLTDESSSSEHARKSKTSSSSKSVRRMSSKEGRCERKQVSKLDNTQKSEIKEVDVSSDYHNNETFALQGGSRIETSREENPATPTQTTCETPGKTISRKSSTTSSSFSFPPPPDFIQSIVVHPSPEKRTPKKQKTGDVSKNANLDKSGLATVLFETNNSALPSMMPGSIIDLVNVPTEPPPPSLMMTPVKEDQILAEDHPANLTTSEGAQSFHLEYSFSSMENSIEIIEDGKSIARKVENLSATEEQPNLNLSSSSEVGEMDDTKLRLELRKFKVCVPPCLTDAARCRFKGKLRKMRDVGVEFSAELIEAIHTVDIRGPPTGENNLRNKVCNDSRTPGKDPKRFFNYLLLDPRKTNNLTRRVQQNPNLSSVDILKCFMKSIFYVGKGTGTRAHAHIKEAMDFSSKKPGYKMKLKTIQEIFATPRSNVQPNEEQNFGLLVCEFSKNISNAQALNQEAAMIEAINIENLTNYKREKFSLKWKDEDIRELGAELLCQACRMYLIENEHFLYPSHV